MCGQVPRDQRLPKAQQPCKVLDNSRKRSLGSNPYGTHPRTSCKAGTFVALIGSLRSSQSAGFLGLPCSTSPKRESRPRSGEVHGGAWKCEEIFELAPGRLDLRLLRNLRKSGHVCARAACADVCPGLTTTASLRVLMQAPEILARNTVKTVQPRSTLWRIGPQHLATSRAAPADTPTK